MIRLPEKPTGDQYEDLVASAIRSLGYFTETKIRLRGDTKEVLELDVVGTPSGEGFRNRALFEAKKEGPRFEFLFKVFGQRIYLGIDRGYVVHPKPIDDRDRPDYDEICGNTNVACPVLPWRGENLPNHLEELAPLCTEYDKKTRTTLAVVGWWGQIAQRLAYAEFKSYCAQRKDSDLCRRSREYVQATEQSFFQKVPLVRVQKLYAAYQDSPRLAGEFVDDLAQAQRTEATAIWNTLNDWHANLWVQYVMLLQHKARHAVVKNALDHLLAEPDDDGARVNGRIRMRGRMFLEAIMPRSFLNGMSRLRDHPHRLRIPYLFQVFLENFGGFLNLGDRDELELIGKVTGITPEEVVAALRLQDDFFPLEEGSWFYTQRDEILCMKMVPGFMRGCGCFLRGTAFGMKDYDERFPKMGWLLSKWHNAAYHTLKRELKVEEGVLVGRGDGP